MAGVLVLPLCIIACGSRGARTREPVGETTVTSANAQRRADGYVPPAIELYLARQLPGPCGMARLPALDFSYGSADLETAQDLDVAKLAECLHRPPFDAARVVLVGHADPIGSASYNLELAFERARRVRSRLVDFGIDPSRILVTSAGEAALPPDRWVEARRVEIVLARPQ